MTWHLAYPAPFILGVASGRPEKETPRPGLKVTGGLGNLKGTFGVNDIGVPGGHEPDERYAGRSCHQLCGPA